MSEKNLFPAELRVLLLAGAVGVMVTAGWLAAMAALMTAQGYSGAAAPPLATAAVGAGSLCSGWIAAFCKKERGLLCGLVQGLFYAVLLVVLSIPSGTLTEEPPLLRFAVVILCGSIGGLLGMVSREVRSCGSISKQERQRTCQKPRSRFPQVKLRFCRSRGKHCRQNDPHRKCLHRCRDITRKPGRKPAGCSSVPF